MSLAIAQLLFYIELSFLNGKTVNQKFYPYKSQEKGEDIGNLFAFAAFTCLPIGLTLFIFMFERIYKRSKYLLTLASLILIVTTVVVYPFNLNLAYDLEAIGVLSTALLYFLIMLYFAKESRAEFRPVVLFILIGSLIVGIGHVLKTTIVGVWLKRQPNFPSEIVPILYITGALITITPSIINPEHLTRGLWYWYTLLVVILFLSPFATFILILLYISPPEYATGNPLIFLYVGVFGWVFILFIFYKTVKIVKERERGQITEEPRDLLKIFSRPQKLTEEEVSVSKDKKICLVCKGKISRLNYICPTCKSFYCVKCSKFLEESENGCWACETPFDESKPIKILKKMEEKRVVKGDFHKK